MVRSNQKHIYAKVKQLRASAEYATLTPTRQRIVDNDLRDFRLFGAELLDDKKPRYKAMQREMWAYAAKFSENLLDPTNAHVECITDEAQLAGIPEDVKAAARKDDAWELTLRAPCYIPVMQYAENRELRARMYRAFATRASEFGQPEWDNGPLITRLLHLRAEEAAMLGYGHYAEVSLVHKMDESTKRTCCRCSANRATRPRRGLSRRSTAIRWCRRWRARPIRPRRCGRILATPPSTARGWRNGWAGCACRSSRAACPKRRYGR